MTRTMRSALAAIAIVALVFAAYLPGRNGGFTFDDGAVLQRNATLQAVDGFDADKIFSATFSSNEGSSVGRPLAMFTFALNQATTGGDPAPMKLTNVALHALNALLVGWLALRLLGLPIFAGVSATRRRWAAAFIATAWALHPLHATAVLYLVQRMEVLSHTFVFLGLLLYLAGRTRQLAGQAGGMALAGARPWWLARSSASCRRNRQRCCRCMRCAWNFSCSDSVDARGCRVRRCTRGRPSSSRDCLRPFSGSCRACCPSMRPATSRWSSAC